MINECQTRQDTEDLRIWKEAGLLLDSTGLVVPSNTSETGYPEGDGVMKEDMISNALVWLMSKLINYIAAGESFHPTPAGYRPENSAEENHSPTGVSQQTLLGKWSILQHELDVWFGGLPETFKPCVRLEPLRHVSQAGEESPSTPFSEIWYGLPMCGSTMQSYHMARILLLINKPHESTARRSSVGNRLNSYRSIGAEIRYHSREIVGFALSRPEASIRIHQLQPLFVAGQCLTEPGERRVVLDLLRGIEADLGWATGYRVQQLLREWGWDENSEFIQT